jgi:hypothetical protein
MKGEVVFASRERGLRLIERDVEPQVSASNNSVERKPDTMKTYILRELKTVEPQKSMTLPKGVRQNSSQAVASLGFRVIIPRSLVRRLKNVLSNGL